MVNWVKCCTNTRWITKKNWTITSIKLLTHLPLRVSHQYVLIWFYLRKTHTAVEISSTTVRFKLFTPRAILRFTLRNFHGRNIWNLTAGVSSSRSGARAFCVCVSYYSISSGLLCAIPLLAQMFFEICDITP